jgi:hypothetical protein
MSSNTIDPNGRRVLTFQGQVQNLSRLTELTDAVVDIAVSGAWRKYHLATGPETWRAAEFDYFLIAEGVRREDAARVLAYNKRAKDLVPLMDPAADAEGRRPLEQAAKEWNRANIDLIKRARELGWISDKPTRPAGRAAAKPVGAKTISPLSKATRGRVSSGRARQLWSVEWVDHRSAAEAIADKLLRNEVLARDVYNRLEAKRVRTRRADKRTSTA